MKHKFKKDPDTLDGIEIYVGFFMLWILFMEGYIAGYFSR
jgi:hypothetical protein